MKNLATFHEYFLYIVGSNKVVQFDAFVIINETLFRIKKIYVIRQIRLPNLTIYKHKRNETFRECEEFKKRFV